MIDRAERLIDATNEINARAEEMDSTELRAELEKHHYESYGWALSCCARNPAEAENVLQAVYLKVLEGKARFGGKSAFKTWLFAVIRKTAQALSLGEEQKNFFKTEVRQAQTRFTELQWALQDEMEKLSALVKQTRVDEAQTLAQLDKILNLERDIKRAQITLLVRIKNKLTPEQQARLREIQSKPHNK